MRKTEEYNLTLDNEVDTKKKVKQTNEKLNVFEIFEAIIAAFFVITLVFTFMFRVFSVDGPSMKPTLQDGDKVVVSTMGYKAQKGDVVVLSSTEGLKKPIIKRVVAVAGDTVDINFTTGVVTVNGIEEHYTDELTTQQFDVAFPLTVPEGTVFVLGDNRGVSLDSRSTQVGCVDERLIVGKVLFRFFPLGNWTVE
ncbi:MAG: signal peptidase I [Clostridia bacterium]|nr:signal peptidase I [Clostridia bacterium]MBP3560329.1 signal peptidase I [Clostridia bacterium]